MSKTKNASRAWGSPSRYIQGRHELDRMKTYTDIYGKRVFFIIDVFFYKTYKEKFEEMYKGSDCRILCEQFGGQCTEEEIERCTKIAAELKPDVVVGVGGGKTLDTSKGVADNFSAAMFIVPTTASTDAPGMDISVLYTAEGEHVGARPYKKNPDAVIVDTDVIAKAPVRFLVAGMGDALSTYIEARACERSCSQNYVMPFMGYRPTVAVMAVAKACHETILKKGVRAKIAAEYGICTQELEDVVEANTLMSGLGVQNASCAGAHSVAEGLTVLPACAKLLHGEVVAFGILVQLVLENTPEEELTQIYDFFGQTGLPMTFEELNIPDVTEEELIQVAEASMHSYWEVESFTVTPEMVVEGMKMADILGKRKKRENM